MIIATNWLQVQVRGESKLLDVSLKALKKGGIIVAQSVPERVSFETWLDREAAVALRDWLIKHLNHEDEEDRA